MWVGYHSGVGCREYGNTASDPTNDGSLCGKLRNYVLCAVELFSVYLYYFTLVLYNVDILIHLNSSDITEVFCEHRICMYFMCISI